MAEVVAVDLLINAAQSAKTVKEVRQAMKDLKNGMLEIGDEGSKDFQRLAKAGAELKDSIGDINERMDAFNPDKMNAFGAATRIAANGVQLVTSAMALFGDQSEDVQKAMMKVQASMAFAQAIGGLKDLKKEFQTLFSFLQANPLLAIATALVAIGTAAYGVFKAFQEANLESGKMTKQLEKQKEVTAQLTAQYEAQITVLEAQGGSEKEVFEIKKKMLQLQIADLETSIKIHEKKVQEVADNDSLWESVMGLVLAYQEFAGQEKQAENTRAAIAQNKKERAEEDLKALQDEQNQLVQLKASVEALEISETNRLNNVAKANKESKQKQAEDAAKSNDEQWAKELELLQQTTDAANADEALRAEARQKDIKNHADYVKYKHQLEDAALKAQQARDKAAFELKKKLRQEDLNMASQALGIASELSGKNAKAQKGFAAAQTLVDTYLAAQKAFTSQFVSGDPTALVRAIAASGIALASGFARVKKILAVNMDSPSFGGTGGGSDSGAGSGIAALSVAPQVQPTTQLDSNGNVVTPQQQQQQPMQAFMVESQARGVQNRVQMFENMSRV